MARVRNALQPAESQSQAATRQSVLQAEGRLARRNASAPALPAQLPVHSAPGLSQFLVALRAGLAERLAKDRLPSMCAAIRFAVRRRCRLAADSSPSIPASAQHAESTERRFRRP